MDHAHSGSSTACVMTARTASQVDSACSPGVTSIGNGKARYVHHTPRYAGCRDVAGIDPGRGFLSGPRRRPSPRGSVPPPSARRPDRRRCNRLSQVDTGLSDRCTLSLTNPSRAGSRRPGGPGNVYTSSGRGHAHGCTLPPPTARRRLMAERPPQPVNHAPGRAYRSSDNRDPHRLRSTRS